MSSTTKRDSLIERRYLAGASYAEIGRELGLSRERVRQILLHRGAPTQGDRLAERLKAAVAEVTKGGANPRDVAKARGLGIETLRRALKQAGFVYAEALRDEARAEREARLEGKGKTTCTHCGQVKSWSEMAVTSDRHGVVRRRRHCRECAAAGVRSWYYRNRGRTPEPTVDSKTCGRCQESKPATEFWRNTAARDGLQSWCKSCINEHKREEREY